MAEMLEVFDSSYNSIGQESRTYVHKHGLWHLNFHCWVARKRDNKVYVLFQKRSVNKLKWPGLFDIAAAGHLEYGEKPESGIREIKEELGINVDTKNLRYLGLHISVYESHDRNDNEFQHVYLLEDDTPLSRFKIQEEEVGGLVEIELAEALKLFFGEVGSIKCNGVCIENGMLMDKKYVVMTNNFVPCIDGYYKNALIAIQRYFAGEKYLSV
jgi:isopentenyldiphosphate isomerase